VTNFIGIDAGTSFIKGALIDLDALALRRTERAPFPEFAGGLPAGHCEADPRAVMEAVEELLARLTRDAPPIEGVVLCGQMQGFVLVNGRGEAVSNYVSWLDRRVTAAEFGELAALVTPAERSELGNEFRPGIALPLLYWLKRHGRLPAGDATPVSIADFIAGQLCGTQPPMEPTQAAAFGALKLGTLRWHEEVIGKLGLESLRWPEVVPPGTPAGMWRGAPCYATAGDQQCAIAGALTAEGELSVNIGTGSQVSLITGSADGGAHHTRPYFDGRFIRTVTHIPGGRSLGALVGLLTGLGGPVGDAAWERIQAAVREVPSTDLRADMAFLPGPCGDSGSLANLHEGNMTAGHVFRAAFEAMARNHAECARRLDPGGTARRAVFSGGVARRLEILRELIAGALGLPYRLSPHPEDTLFGLMVLALAFSGRYDSVRTATEAALESGLQPARSFSSAEAGGSPHRG
jgi:sugar (pentulose or hexulose) kinase